jgi:hypothetical protein
MWCMRSDPNNCFSEAKIVEQYPQAFLDESGPSSEAPGATDYAICLEPDTGTDSCPFAVTISARYFPVGVGWNCVQLEVPEHSACDPDYTSAHDPSQPRVVVIPNHQMDAEYHDSEPMYQVSAGE